MTPERDKQVWDINLATTALKYSQADCVRLIEEVFERKVPVQPGESYDVLADLTDQEIAKLHAVLTEPCPICGEPLATHDDEVCREEYES